VLFFLVKSIKTANVLMLAHKGNERCIQETPMNKETLKTIFTDSIRYWEIQRIIYNVVLALIVGICFYLGLPGSWENLSLDFLLGLFLLAVVANIAFCTAYLPDVFIQLSGLNDKKKYFRLAIFIVGLMFAAILTRFVAMGMFQIK
jgi:hypothetical protein